MNMFLLYFALLALRPSEIDYFYPTSCLVRIGYGIYYGCILYVQNIKTIHRGEKISTGLRLA